MVFIYERVRSMNKLLQSSKLFLKRNGATILTVVGSVGVVATTIAAVKATPKALTLLEHAKEEKGEELTTFEQIKVAGPVYIPTAALGVTTVTCILGVNILNKRAQASLVSAYALLDQTYKEYKEKVKELYGEDSDILVRAEIAKDHLKESDVEYEDNRLLFYDEYSKQYFNRTMEEVLKAEYLLNRNLSCHGYACLNEFYDLLKLPQTDFGDILGWHADSVQVTQWYIWIEFYHRKVELEDGMECYILEISTEPVPNFEDF